MIVPKCKQCNWNFYSGKKSFCNHPRSPQAKKKDVATYIPSKERKPSPSWCPLRIGGSE